MEKPESENYNWRFVTADGVLALGRCELLFAYLVVSAASTDSYLYDGIDTGGTKIVALESAAVTGHEFKPPKPVKCEKGLYVDVGTNVTGIFVQWRELKN